MDHHRLNWRCYCIPQGYHQQQRSSWAETLNCSTGSVHQCEEIDYLILPEVLELQGIYVDIRYKLTQACVKRSLTVLTFPAQECSVQLQKLTMSGTWWWCERSRATIAALRQMQTKETPHEELLVFIPKNHIQASIEVAHSTSWTIITIAD